MSAVLAAVGAGAMVVIACSAPFSDAGDTPPDASEAAAVPDAGSVLGPTPGISECPGAGTSCDVVNGTCCVNPDAGASRCQAQSCIPFVEVSFKCDDSADCAPGERCCTVFGTSSCAKTARCAEEQLCRTNAECPTGVSCVPVLCRGRQVGSCGALRAAEQAFCDGK